MSRRNVQPPVIAPAIKAVFEQEHRTGAERRSEADRSAQRCDRHGDPDADAGGARVESRRGSSGPALDGIGGDRRRHARDPRSARGRERMPLQGCVEIATISPAIGEAGPLDHQGGYALPLSRKWNRKSSPFGSEAADG